MTRFVCEMCQKCFGRLSALKRHLRVIHKDGFLCEYCGEICDSLVSLRKHLRTVHPNIASDKELEDRNLNLFNDISLPRDSQDQKQITNMAMTISLQDVLDAGSSGAGEVSLKCCEVCKIDVHPQDWKYHLRTNKHKKNAAIPLNANLKSVKSSFSERIETFIFENENESLLDAIQFFKLKKNLILEALLDLLAKHDSYKFNFELFGEYIKVAKENEAEGYEIVTTVKSFQSKMEVILSRALLSEIYEDMVEKIISKMQEFQERDSGWSLVRICHVEVNVNQYRPLRGAQYLSLPTFIVRKHACINVKNSDIYCFKWAIISALTPVDISSARPSSYGIRDITAESLILRNGIKLNFAQLEFPLPVSNVSRFEELNSTISVNVFGYEQNGINSYDIVGPYYCTKEEKATHINLLLIQNEERCHYVWIKNISRYDVL